MRCLIVDDHPLSRDGTALALRAAHAAVEVVEAASLADSFALLTDIGPVDLVLLDLDLGDSQGVDTLSRFKAWCEAHDHDARIVVLSGHAEPELVRAVVNQCATGFIVKATSRAIFQQAIALTLAGGVYIPELALRDLHPAGEPAAATAATEAAPSDAAGQPPLQLTPREHEVAAFLVQGYTYKRIARELQRSDGHPVSEHTIRAHVGHIAWKLGVNENAKAGVMAAIARRGLRFVPPPLLR